MNWKEFRCPMKSLNLDASVVQRAAPGAFWEGWGGEAKCCQMSKKIDFFTFCLLSGIFLSFFVLLSLLKKLVLGMMKPPETSFGDDPQN